MNSLDNPSQAANNAMRGWLQVYRDEIKRRMRGSAPNAFVSALFENEYKNEEICGWFGFRTEFGLFVYQVT